MIKEHRTKDGIIFTGSGYCNPESPQPGQKVGMPSRWVKVDGKWYLLDLYCDRVRHGYLEAIANCELFTTAEFLELIQESFSS